ncbi:A1S_2505 family phage non-structural protein [Sphingomonas sp. GB1N7]|uniref:A1S_2505 family phage non-structural protein n=1 Tax=Parasphingomonas caseinilytica TaxID=3096158 RepID=UPI002FCB67FA
MPGGAFARESRSREFDNSLQPNILIFSRSPSMQTLTSPPVFVFGSNLAGRHGKGAALWARRRRGAIYGRGIGRQGNAYAIPTNHHDFRVLPLAEIAGYVAAFLDYARRYPDIAFELTPIGCGLAGYRPEQIAPMFSDAPPNVALPDVFAVILYAA